MMPLQVVPTKRDQVYIIYLILVYFVCIPFIYIYFLYFIRIDPDAFDVDGWPLPTKVVDGVFVTFPYGNY